jgi:hypothetical protein
MVNRMKQDVVIEVEKKVEGSSQSIARFRYGVLFGKVLFKTVLVSRCTRPERGSVPYRGP